MSTTDNQLLYEIEKTKQAESESRTRKATTRAHVLGIVVITLGIGYFISTHISQRTLDRNRQALVEVRAENDHTMQNLQRCKTELRALDRIVKESHTSPTP